LDKSISGGIVADSWLFTHGVIPGSEPYSGSGNQLSRTRRGLPQGLAMTERGNGALCRIEALRPNLSRCRSATRASQSIDPRFGAALINGPNNSSTGLLSILQNGRPKSEMLSLIQCKYPHRPFVSGVGRSERLGSYDLGWHGCCCSGSRPSKMQIGIQNKPWTVKLATATRERIGDRFIMSLPPRDRDIAAIAASRGPRNLTKYGTS
jgi:hypothetical protein